MMRQELIDLFYAVDPVYMQKIQDFALKEKAAMETKKEPETISMPTCLANQILAQPLVSNKKKARFIRNATYLELPGKRKKPHSTIYIRDLIDVEELVRNEEADRMQQEAMANSNILHDPKYNNANAPVNQ